MCDNEYMRRALELAGYGRGFVSPNPMVGAVIVRNGEIIGEGYHRRWGEAHAEVNAVNSVKDKNLLKDATIYVTLEPCSHYGKTPPCAKLLIECGFKRVVIGTLDPFEKVSGRGVKMLREAGIEVEVGVLDEECRQLNYIFMTAHLRSRPVVTIKWAQSRDGWMDRKRTPEEPAQRFSNALTSQLTAKLRAENDVIMTTGATVRCDNPRLTVRGWDGRNPRPVILTSKPIEVGSHIADNESVWVYDDDVESVLCDLYSRGVTSVLVESGPTLLREIIERKLWDFARVEVADFDLGDSGEKAAPVIPYMPDSEFRIGSSRLYFYRSTSSHPIL
ncbi:MAG: bifunctional diaminohydroxyphosphoribosylaminopyrimidine deaminase/5-amino-6-(5-phosphoribosylamino)uracil reductase RibD [Muribaculaceae bacterium]|nr:bifunctional diaminohydroxyphosphoribosylaminopyrimidine deaminase/5-amino-6-(5-phosphoribosylamino)uracil reductase RibD [Muribaculaceae bacterium]